MSLNSYVPLDVPEIGWTQAVQAEAAELACHVDMKLVVSKTSFSPSLL